MNHLRITIIISILIGITMNACKKEEVPTITTNDISNITGTTATCGGIITGEGTGTVISRGVCWSTNTNPTITDQKTVDGAGAGNFSSNLIALNGGTTYYVRAYATNSVGTGYGMAMAFKTLGQLPSVTTLSATDITMTTAQLNGVVSANYLNTEVLFEYGTTTNYGFTKSPSEAPLSGNEPTNFSAVIDNLIPGTTYHFRIIATNSLGKAIGDDFVLKYMITDVEGNTYGIVSLGNQIWMRENLKTTKYRNGDIIGTTIPPTLDISDEIAPKYQWAYDGNEANVNTYGRLYTWYAVTDSRNVCPLGWHVPSVDEWNTLISFLGGEVIAGDKMKETGTDHWVSNMWGSNESGFTGLPGGNRVYSNVNEFGYLRTEGDWWTSTNNENIVDDAFYKYLHYSFSKIVSSSAVKQVGFSIRCIKD